jgi:glucosyl-dolichyl phosphate glucuronosyltransferase
LQHPDISIIIPTYNRAADLNETLRTIFDQSVKANEIIIVDDSDNDDTESLVKRLNQIFQPKNLIYIKNEGIKSIPAARNAGVRKAKGDIVVFLDDDAILDKNYLLGIREVFETNPNALGAQGWMVQERHKGIFNDLLRATAKAFFLGHTGVNECRAFSSTNVTYPSILDRIIPCQWLHGCNFSFLREVFEEFSFDEKLEEYAWKEDLDFSYRIHKKYSDFLYITPKARLIHKESLAGRRPLKQTIMIKESYALYIFFKDFDSPSKIKLYLCGAN